MRCAATTKAGTRCRLDATHGSRCYQHAPETADERRRSASKGGRSGGRGRPGGPELADVRRGLWDVIRDVRTGNLERAKGAVMVQAFGQLVRVCEVQRRLDEQDEVLARIERLESGAAELAQANGGEWWQR